MGRDDEVFSDNPPGLTDRLSGARVGIAGCGGIGSNVAMLLARAGVGTLVIADFDRVETRNLNRQHYTARHIGTPKVIALRDQIESIPAGTAVEAHEVRIDHGNAVSLFEGCHLLIEALDLDESKEMLLNAWLTGMPDTPVVACSGLAGTADSCSVRVDRRGGGLTVVGDGQSHLDLGTLSARVSLVASMMALEAVRLLSRGASACGSCTVKCSKEVELVCNGAEVPLSGFPAKALSGAVRGLLSAYRGVDPSGGITLKIGPH
ncbi:MAG: sulfur carrier protein ThiS adenylyltransferase ThiF [Candidatus Fermentibacteraceae bacterium]